MSQIIIFSLCRRLSPLWHCHNTHFRSQLKCYRYFCHSDTSKVRCLGLRHAGVLAKGRPSIKAARLRGLSPETGQTQGIRDIEITPKRCIFGTHLIFVTCTTDVEKYAMSRNWPHDVAIVVAKSGLSQFARFCVKKNWTLIMLLEKNDKYQIRFGRVIFELISKRYQTGLLCK